MLTTHAKYPFCYLINADYPWGLIICDNYPIHAYLIHANYPIDTKYPIPANTSHINNSNTSITSTSQETLESNFDCAVTNYIIDTISVLDGQGYYKPFDTASFLFFHKPFMINDRNVSQYTLILSLIKKDMVPIQKTVLYNLISRFELELLLENDTWTSVTKKGNKPLLPSHKFKRLISTLREETTGGRGMSFPQVKYRIQQEIRNHWTSKGKLHLLNEPSNQTLNIYASKIFSQDIFNIETSLKHKTESRAAAEWSIRSAIAYTMAVSVTHFIISTQQTPFHPKKKEVSQEALQLWNLAETYYSKMTESENNKVDLLPVLPNLITSTDEVTISATTSKINNEESSYIVSRPTETQNE